ncbi:hypothetical protein GCM10010403_14070 [Glycomyces rutgersensis]|uniref:Uncharacterized protein n=1 Tax=Glycomyces rutgersensis TaxID=58115 RepID=A0ABN3FA57_9ACTN
MRQRLGFKEALLRAGLSGMGLPFKGVRALRDSGDDFLRRYYPDQV